MMDQSASVSLENRSLALDGQQNLSDTRFLPLESETANQWTHAFGFLLSVAAAAYMLSAVADAPASVIVGCSIYLGTLVALYAASTLSHSFDDDRRRTFFRTVDQVCIFLLVAGTYTPFGMICVTEGPLTFILGAMWSLVAAGIYARVRYGDGAVAIAFFVIIGWMPIFALGEIYSVGGPAGLALVLAGGIAYTGGTWFLVNDHRHPYLHAVWHLCTIFGSAMHYLFLLNYVALS